MDAIRLELDAEGIAWVVFDDPNGKVNIFNTGNVALLNRILDELTAKVPKGVVFISGKPGTFIAGANIKEIAEIREASRGEELARVGQNLLAKIENLPVPTVAAIDGACLGGGCEMSLACRYRVATDNPKTQIGLPETQLGIIPGWGGTQRLPQLIGLRSALGIIIPGQTLDAKRALKIGLVDAVVPPIALRQAATKFITKGGPARKAQSSWPPEFLVRSVARRQTLGKTRGHYPAPLLAIDVAANGYDGEAHALGKLIVTPECKNLIRVFFLREKYLKLRLPGGENAKKVEKVGVLGAGVMGAGIAQWCSSRGLTVRLKDIKPEFVAAGMKRITAAYQEGVKRHKMSALDMQHGLAHVHPTTDYTGFGDCDIVIEAVLEKIEVKRPAFAELSPLLSPTCIIASNTSAIPIDDLAVVTGRLERFVGIHFFNPVHKMPLVEVVRGTKTAPEVVAAAVEFAKQLKKIPIVVSGTPGFLINRLLMPYLNEAGLILSEGASVETIDKAMLDFGMPMGPLRLIDEVGIDVTYDVAHELAESFKDRMTIAPIIGQLNTAGLKGRKGGKGFYLYAGKKESVNPQFGGSDRPADVIQRRLMGVMIAEAKRCLQDHVVETEDDIDVGMIFGTGFPPFRGGLVKYARDASLW